MGAILVTGSAGFIGRALVARLRSERHAVLEFDREHGDLNLRDALEPHIPGGVSHVFHLAGKTFVPESWRDPISFYQINVMGTIHVLEFCRRTGAQLVFLSSYPYGEPRYLPVDEIHPIQAYNPYSQSKILAESACRFYVQEFNLPATILRIFNVYGPGQKSDFLIPEIIHQVLDPSVTTVEVKDLRPKRDYVFLEDLLDVLLLSLDQSHGIYNVASGESWSVEGIIQVALKISGASKGYRSTGPVRRNEILDLYADVSKIRREWNWSPKISLPEGIERCLKAPFPSG